MGNMWAATPRYKATELSEHTRPRNKRITAAAFIGTMMMLVGFGTSASNEMPRATIVNSPLQGATGLVATGFRTAANHSPATSPAAVSAAATLSPAATRPSTKTGAARPATVSGLKLPLLGLLDRQGAPSASFYSVLDGFVVNVSWASLQTSAGGPITSNNAIDKAIGQVTSLNATGAHLALKLRIFAGESAPTWAKSIGGTPLAGDRAQTIGRWWTPAYEAAYAQLQVLLAAKYDSVPQIREVTIGGCMTQYVEPLLKNDFSTGASLAGIQAAGYTTALDVACEKASIDAGKAWATTRQDFSFNPFNDGITNPNAGGQAITLSLISYCRSALGATCILENNSLRVASQSALYDQMYAAIKAGGLNVCFQTATLVKVGSLVGTLSKGAGLGAGSIELPSGYQTTTPIAFALMRAQLIANVRP